MNGMEKVMMMMAVIVTMGPMQEEAAQAHDEASRQLRGPSAKTNFNEDGRAISNAKLTYNKRSGTGSRYMGKYSWKWWFLEREQCLRNILPLEC